MSRSFSFCVLAYTARQNSAISTHNFCRLTELCSVWYLCKAGKISIASLYSCSACVSVIFSSNLSLRTKLFTSVSPSFFMLSRFSALLLPMLLSRLGPHPSSFRRVYSSYGLWLHLWNSVYHTACQNIHPFPYL